MAQREARTGSIAWHALAAQAVAGELATSVENGLTEQEAAHRFNRQGPNELPEVPPPSPPAFLSDSLQAFSAGTMGMEPTLGRRTSRCRSYSWWTSPSDGKVAAVSDRGLMDRAVPISTSSNGYGYDL